MPDLGKPIKKTRLEWSMPLEISFNLDLFFLSKNFLYTEIVSKINSFLKFLFSSKANIVLFLFIAKL